MSLDTAGALLAVITGVGAILEGIRRWIYKPLSALFRKVDVFLDDWSGVEDRAGVPGRLGVMARLAVVEANLATVAHEVTPNSGGSLKDVAVSTRRELRLHIAEAARDRQWLVEKGQLPPLPIIPKQREEQP